MSETKRCILSEKHRDGCASCTLTCSHRIAMHGLDGTGGRTGASNLPEGYSYLTLSNSPVRASQTRIYRMLGDYIATFERQFEENAVQIKSLYLFSESPGTGKTSTATALLNEFIIAHYLGSLKRNRQALQQPAYFLDVNEWQTEYNEFNRPRVPDSIAEPAAARYYSAMEKARLAPFAVLDDIGVREASEGFRADLHAIINHRVASEKPTVYTSNLPIEDLARVFDKRLYDRIRDMCVEVYFEGESKRGRR